MTARQLTIAKPDDWHLHLRDGIEMTDVVRYSAERFGRALIMPNLSPPITTTAQAERYRDQITKAAPDGKSFYPYMTLYLTDNTPPKEIVWARNSWFGFVKAAKLYPAGATTNSDLGVTDIRKVYPVLEQMQKHGMVLCVHGEVTDPDVDIFDREAVFFAREARKLTRDFPNLKIVFEHITTIDGLVFVRTAGPNVAATITAHHLLLNRNALFSRGLRPHNYCLPVYKRERDRHALLQAATSGNPKFFLGTDSAPHSRRAKESECGCAGCFTANASIELYAEAFDSVGKLDMLEGFASHFGADFYGLPRNRYTITLVNEPWRPFSSYNFGYGKNRVVPFRAGETLSWKLQL